MQSLVGIEGHVLQHPIQNTGCFTLCPTMDLVSFPLNERVVLIYRRGNEKVWDIESHDSKQQSNEKLQSIKWKPDGNMFATVSEIGNLALFKTSTGNQLRELHLPSPIKYLKWYSTDFNPSSVKKLDDVLKDLDITNSLPLLTQDLSLSTDVNLENTSVNKKLDFILAVSDFQKLCCIFSGIFVIEDIDLFSDETSEFIEIVQCPDNSDLYCLFQKESGIYLSTLSTPMSINDNKFTNILITCSKLISIVDYFDVSMKQINAHHKPYINYTVRIIELLRGEINDDLNNNGVTESEKANKVYDENKVDEETQVNADPVYDLYDLLLTGSLSNSTKTWLTDYVSDRGMKRWTKLGRAYFDNAKSITFNDIVTSLHHLIVLFTDLNGLNALNNNISYKKNVDDCIEVATNYLKYSYKYIMELSENQRCFEQTILWLSSVLNEIINDEKTHSNRMVNEITKYLTALSERLNSNSENIEGVGLEEHTELLSNNFKELLVKIKSDIRSRFKLENPVKIDLLNLTQENYQIKIFERSTAIILDKGLAQITLCKINLINMEQEKFVLKDLQKENIIDLLLLNETNLLVLYCDRLELKQLNWKNSTILTIKTMSLFSCSDFNVIDFSAAHIRANADNTTFCIMDSSLKKYVWVNF